MERWLASAEPLAKPGRSQGGCPGKSGFRLSGFINHHFHFVDHTKNLE
jgi:hypothetical protein